MSKREESSLASPSEYRLECLLDEKLTDSLWRSNSKYR